MRGLPVDATLVYPCTMVFGRSRSTFQVASSPGDATLVARARAGDELAFEALVGQHESAVYQVAWRMLGNREDALDAVQETFVRVFRGLASFRGEAALRTWVYGIALNVCRNKLASSEMRARTRRESLQIQDPGGGEEVDRPLPDPEPGPEVRAYGSELRRALETALGQLSSEHREIIVLRDIQGLEYEELASALGCALGTVKSRLARARAALRGQLQGVWP
jgi:RNA polymerase sigma-70 factor, ECF subfamily